MRAILISIIALLQLANAAPRESQHDNRASARIKWAPCEPDIPNLKCGQLTVPLDWSKPHGKQITLAVNKVKASDPSKRIGSVVVNPGGPGGSGTQVCQKQAQGNLIISETTNEYFDIVCPDPRGVGNSAPIRCDYSLWNQRLSLFPTDPASYNELLKHNKAFGQSCLDLSGDIVNHVDTLSVVKDVEALRVALVRGTIPTKHRAMVLDGVDDHSVVELYTLTAESEAYERELDRFFDWCTSNTTCALHGQDVATLFDNLVTRAAKTPIPAPGCVESADTLFAGTCFDHVTG